MVNHILNVMSAKGLNEFKPARGKKSQYRNILEISEEEHKEINGKKKQPTKTDSQKIFDFSLKTHK